MNVCIKWSMIVAKEFSPNNKATKNNLELFTYAPAELHGYLGKTWPHLMRICGKRICHDTVSYTYVHVCACICYMLVITCLRVWFLWYGYVWFKITRACRRLWLFMYIRLSVKRCMQGFLQAIIRWWTYILCKECHCDWLGLFTVRTKKQRSASYCCYELV